LIYIFDSGSLINLFKHFYLDRFPSLWEKFDLLIADGRIVSVKEVFREIAGRGDRLSIWSTSNRDFFKSPANEELEFVQEIFKVTHFQSLVRKKEQYLGKPVADPFIIAKAKQLVACVITEELEQPNASKIPNVCNHFKIACSNLEGFMEKENWIF